MTAHAMHIANGIVNGQVSAVFAVISLVALAFCVMRGRADLDDRLAPMAGLVAAFIFAVQMLNFQVLPGVSGHLLGGALAVVLVGPWVGALCVSTVLIVQCLLFADGGLTALGLNIINMAILGTAAGYLLVAGLLRVLPKTPSGVATTAFIASVASVVVASQGFVLEYWMGGTTQLSLGGIAATMAGVHTLIGIGEGLIAATTVATVAKVRPDLVYALRRFRTAPVAPRSGRSRGMSKRTRVVPRRRPARRAPAGRRGEQLRLVQPGRPGRHRPERLHARTPTGRSPAAPAWPSRSRATRWRTARSPTTASAASTTTVPVDRALRRSSASLVTFAIGGGVFWLVRRRQSPPMEA